MTRIGQFLQRLRGRSATERPTAHQGPKDDRDPSEITDLAFGELLPKTPEVPEDEARQALVDFGRSPNAWGAKCIYAGGEHGIRQLVLANLQRIAQDREFRYFSAEVPAGENVVRISAFFDGFLVPVQVWHTKGECFAMGDRGFDHGRVELKSLGVRAVESRSREHQERLVERLAAREIALHCRLCDARWPPSQCGGVTLQEERYILFTCPKCGTRAMSKVEL